MSVVTLIIPSRNRPEQVKQAVLSALTNNAYITVTLDSNDPKLNDYLRIASNINDRRVSWHCDARAKTLGLKINRAAKQTRSNFIAWMPDDHTICSPWWVDKIVEAAKQMPGDIGILYPDDGVNQDFPSCWILHRKTCQALGYFCPEYFPYWFIDTWWHEVGLMSELLFKAGYDIREPLGRSRTHGMKDLRLWRDFFNATRYQRKRDAVELYRAAYGEQPNNMEAKEAIAISLNTYMQTDKWIKTFGQNADSPPAPGYSQIKKAAKNMVWQYQKNQGKSLVSRLLYRIK